MLYQKMRAVMDEVNAIVAERGELVEAIAVALLTRKNLFVLGDTGQAKSYAINLFRERITGARQFERLLSKQADEEQLFGRIDLSTLIPGNPDTDALANDQDYQDTLRALELAKGAGNTDVMRDVLDKLELLRRAAYVTRGNRPKLITAGKIPDSHIAFLDECFKANDGILNALLTALNERRFTNEGETIDIPVISFFTASNEIPKFSNPEEAILKPLYDRLELKLVTEYVQSRDERLRVLRDKQAGTYTRPRNTVTLDELYNMQDTVRQVFVSESINELMDDILCELREKGVHVSDRKYFGYHPLAQASAWLNGEDTVAASDLLILRHYLWNDPGERETVRQILERKCVNPLKDALDDIIRMAAESYADFETNTGADPAKRIGKLRNEFIGLYESILRLQANVQSDPERGQINAATDKLEEFSKKAHAATAFTYAPLNELLAFKRTA